MLKVSEVHVSSWSRRSRQLGKSLCKRPLFSTIKLSGKENDHVA
jgi:hypothetical protein